LYVGTDDGNLLVTKDGGVNWINLTEKDRPLEASLPGFASLRSKVPDLRMEDVRRRGVSPVGRGRRFRHEYRRPPGDRSLEPVGDTGLCHPG